MTTTALPDLPDIDQLPPLTATDDQIFDEIGAVLERHGALTRFGVKLLHQPFGLIDDEVVVEHIDVDD